MGSPNQGGSRRVPYKEANVLGPIVLKTSDAQGYLWGKPLLAFTCSPWRSRHLHLQGRPVSYPELTCTHTCMAEWYSIICSNSLLESWDLTKRSVFFFTFVFQYSYKINAQLPKNSPIFVVDQKAGELERGAPGIIESRKKVKAASTEITWWETEWPCQCANGGLVALSTQFPIVPPAGVWVWNMPPLGLQLHGWNLWDMRAGDGNKS